MLSRYRALAEAGVLGLNRRNGDYISKFNPRRLYPLVDDKLQTKRLALQAGIAVPELYGVIETQHDIRRLPQIVSNHPEFALKPAHGSAGDGIVVVAGRSAGRYRTISGALLDDEFLSHHLSNAINGQFSLGGVPDVVIVEYMVRFSALFERISFQGVPDVRVIVFRGFPIMSMVRLPTRASHGKANLHQGAVGAGIDIATGMTLDGVLGTQVVTHHPDTTNPIAGLQIPDWDTILDISARCYELTGLGYIGVDIVLDRDLGPLVLELNARPGLAIQIANRQGLLRRLQICEQRADFSAAPARRIEFAKREFSHPVGPMIDPGAVKVNAA
ncbi:MAG TPA: alpha-L-glutamate ligase-like protein [Povalibacter sp.]|uniref:alpha-L-glutamate ligase-like protein n=1 Tax=Povalibacter sp. TaxID=1962978 RepID=UPI002C58A486|nr:alpha-L-glutamate ligase-like protein [Povalibacter sp.]HMN47270.1 alpha-L-glutamate ligase-like protein [Povalibacter sp.]